MSQTQITSFATPEGAATSPVAQDFHRLQEHLNQRIIGQPLLTEGLLLAILADGHLLVEGAPGLAKTKAIKELSLAVEGSEHRIQFTPDLLPADLTGTEIYHPEDGSFRFQQGPVFHNFVLADEINRAPAKVQSALLEAMAERQVTVGSETHQLPKIFLVMATQNPIEQEGTYPLPEAQLDRFLLHLRIGPPDAASELKILQLVRAEAQEMPVEPFRPITQASVLAARQEALGVHLSPALENYLVQLVVASREPAAYDADLARWIEWGASPRGSIALDRCSRARAWLRGRSFVTPEDIQAVAPDVLNHRVLPSYEAEATGVTASKIVERILQLVPLP
ncbi:MAG: MoxR family ATPase [Planctomycetota bacterium]